MLLTLTLNILPMFRLPFSATKSSGALGTSMAALGLVIAWVDSHFLTDRLTLNQKPERSLEIFSHILAAQQSERFEDA